MLIHLPSKNMVRLAKSRNFIAIDQLLAINHILLPLLPVWKSGINMIILYHSVEKLLHATTYDPTSFMLKWTGWEDTSESEVVLIGILIFPEC